MELAWNLKLRQVLEEFEAGFRTRDGLKNPKKSGTYPACTAHGLQRRKRPQGILGSELEVALNLHSGLSPGNWFFKEGLRRGEE